MGKFDHEELDVESVLEWSFPSVDLLIKHEELPPPQEEIIEKEDPALIAQQNILRAQTFEIDSLKKEYFKKIALVNQVLAKLEHPLATLDKECIKLLQYIVKVAIKKIAYQELKIDDDLMANMISELNALIPANSGMATVFLSESDHQRLTADQISSHTLLKINPTLSDGDVIIKSNVGEVRAILEDRINQVLGLHDD